MAFVHEASISPSTGAPGRDVLLRTIETLEAQRHVLGEASIDLALGPLRAKLAALDSRAGVTAPFLQRTSERKVVTVLFADLVGFTEMSERLDSETTADIVNGLFDRLVPVIERYGGTIDKFIGDEIMAVFGAPRAAEHHVEHALRAALDMFDALARYNQDCKLTLGLHIGINSGPVIAGDVGSQGRRDYSVTGDTVNVAARLEGAAASGEILVGPSTYRHALQAFEFDELEALPLKGKRRPTQAYRLLGAKKRRLRLPTDGIELAFSGRANELERLIARIPGGRSPPRGCTGIVAPPGMGKSRLLAEFHDRVEGAVHWLEGSGYDYRGDASYAVVREILDDLIGVQPGASGDDVASAFDAYVDALPDRPTPDVRRYLFRLRGLPLDAADEAILDALAPDALRDRMTSAAAAVLSAVAAARPAVVCIEDLHWADASSISMLRALAAHPAVDNVLIVFTARPDPGLAHEWIEHLRSCGDGASVIELQPLSDSVVRALLVDILGNNEASAAMCERIRAKAQGNPFYLVSFLRSLVDVGLATLRAGRLTVTGQADELRVPESLHAAVGARIDNLPSRAKQLLRWTSILGSVFSRAQVACISTAETGSADATEPLSMLVDRQLLEYGEDERLRFVHAVVQDVAYDGMLQRDRRRLHGIVARSLASAIADESEADVSQLAWHYERAGNDHAASLHYEHASTLAAKTFANREQTQYLESALRLADRGDVPRICRLTERLADVLQFTGRFAEACERLESIAGNVAPGTLDAVRIRRKIAKTWTSRQRFDMSNPAIAQARDMLERVPHTASDAAWWREHFAVELFAVWSLYMQARIDEILAIINRLAPEIDGFATLGERGLYHRSVALVEIRQQRYRPSTSTVALAALAVDETRRGGDMAEVCLATFGHAFALLWSGAVAEADVALQDALHDTTRLGDAERNMLCLTYLAVAARMLHDVDRAEAFARAAIAAAHRNASAHYEGVGYANLSWVAWRRGERSAADEHVANARRRTVLPGYPFNWTFAMVELARALEQNDVARAIECAKSMWTPPQCILHGGAQEALEAAIENPTTESLAMVVSTSMQAGYL